MKINLLIGYYSGGATPPLREDAAQTGKFVGQRDGRETPPLRSFLGIWITEY